MSVSVYEIVLSDIPGGTVLDVWGELWRNIGCTKQD